MFRFLMGNSTSQPAPVQQQQTAPPASSGGSVLRDLERGTEDNAQKLEAAEIKLRTVKAEFAAATADNNIPGA